MNGRERILRTIAGQTVDRPPVAPFLHMNFVKEFRQSNDVDVVAETVAIYEELGLDLIHRNCTPDYDDFTIQGPDWSSEVTELHGPDWTETTVTVRTPGGPLRRVTRTGRLYEYESSYFLIEPPIKSAADLELCRRYQPPVPQIDTSNIVRARQLVGDAGITAPWARRRVQRSGVPGAWQCDFARSARRRGVLPRADQLLSGAESAEAPAVRRGRRGFHQSGR